MRSARTSMIRALVWEESVTIPACEPVSEIASWPRSLIAIAQSAQEIALAGREQHVHLAGIGPRSEISRAASTSSSVVLPRAESTATTCLPALARGDDPPGGALELLGAGDRGAAELHHHDPVCAGCAHPREDRRRPPFKARFQLFGKMSVR